MLRRDFTKSNKEYFKQNRNYIIAISLFLVVGLLLLAILGMNGNFEVKGYNEFSVVVTEEGTKTYSQNKSDISSIIDSYEGKFDSLLIYGEGDDTKYVIRYLNNLSDETILEVNELIAEKLEVDLSKISEHVKVGSSIQTKDYIYTIASVLLIILIATIFSYARYNGASALAVMLGCFVGTLGFISFGSILRLSFGLSYMAMMVILNLLISYIAISLFETMHKSNWLASGDYSAALGTALKKSKFSTTFVSVGLLLIGLMFVLFAPLTIKLVSINVMFMAVVVMATGLYVVPFVWNVFISKCRKREYKVKANNQK